MDERYKNGQNGQLEMETDLRRGTSPEMTDKEPFQMETGPTFHHRMRQRLPKLMIGLESDQNDEDSLNVAAANADSDTRLHGVKNIEELEARLRQLSQDIRKADRDPILRMIRFSGECTRIAFKPDVERRHMDFDNRYFVTQYSRFSAYRNKKGLLRALDFAYRALPSAIIYPGDECFPSQDIASLRLKSHDDDVLSVTRPRGLPFLPFMGSSSIAEVPAALTTTTNLVTNRHAGQVASVSMAPLTTTAAGTASTPHHTTGPSGPNPSMQRAGLVGLGRNASFRGSGGGMGGGGADDDEYDHEDHDDNEGLDQFDANNQTGIQRPFRSFHIAGGSGIAPPTPSMGGSLPPPTPSMGGSSKGRGFFGSGRGRPPPSSVSTQNSSSDCQMKMSSTTNESLKSVIQEDGLDGKIELTAIPSLLDAKEASVSEIDLDLKLTKKRDKVDPSTRERDEQMLIDMGVETEESPTSSLNPSTKEDGKFSFQTESIESSRIRSGKSVEKVKEECNVVCNPITSEYECSNNDDDEEDDKDNKLSKLDNQFVSDGFKLIPLGKQNTIPSLAGLISDSHSEKFSFESDSKQIPLASPPNMIISHVSNSVDKASTLSQPDHLQLITSPGSLRPQLHSMSVANTPQAAHLATPMGLGSLSIQSPPHSLQRGSSSSLNMFGYSIAGAPHQGLSYGVSPGGATTSVSSRHRKGASSISVTGLYSQAFLNSPEKSNTSQSTTSLGRKPEGHELAPSVGLPSMIEVEEPVEVPTNQARTDPTAHPDLPAFEFSNEFEEAISPVDNGVSLNELSVLNELKSPQSNQTLSPQQNESTGSASVLSSTSTRTSISLEQVAAPSQQSISTPPTTTSAQVLMMLSRPRVSSISSNLIVPESAQLSSHPEDEDAVSLMASNELNEENQDRFGSGVDDGVTVPEHGSTLSGLRCISTRGQEDGNTMPGHRHSLPPQPISLNPRAISANTFREASSSALVVEDADFSNMDPRRRSTSAVLSIPPHPTPTNPSAIGSTSSTSSSSSSPTQGSNVQRTSSNPSSTATSHISWGSLLLGGGEAAKKYDFLEYQGVRAVINCASCSVASEASHISDLQARGIDYISFNWNDSDIQLLLPEDVETAIRLIHKVRTTPLPTSYMRTKISSSRPGSGSSQSNVCGEIKKGFGSGIDVGIARNRNGEDMPEMDLSPPTFSRPSISGSQVSRISIGTSSGDQSQSAQTSQLGRSHTLTSATVQALSPAPLRGGSVLIHCYAGRSRSAAVVIAYVATVQGVSVTTALDLVQSRRPVAQPNMNFMRQLQAMEADGLFLRLHAEFCGLPVTHHHKHSAGLVPGVPAKSALSYSTMAVLPGRPQVTVMRPQSGQSQSSEKKDAFEHSMPLAGTSLQTIPCTPTSTAASATAAVAASVAIASTERTIRVPKTLSTLI